MMCMIVGGQTEARAQLSSTIIDYHEPFDQGFTRKFNEHLKTGLGNTLELGDSSVIFLYVI